MEKIKGVFGGRKGLKFWRFLRDENFKLEKSSGDADLSPITEVVGGENSSLCPSMSFKGRVDDVIAMTS